MDFNDPKRKRTPKASAKAYKRIASSYTIDWKYFPTPDVWIPAPGDAQREYQKSNAAVLYFSPLIISFALLRILIRF